MTQVLQVDVRSLQYLGYDYLATEIGFVGLYAYLHARVMDYVILPLSIIYFLLFLIHVKKGTVDLFRRDPVLKYKKNRRGKAKFKRLLLYTSVGLILGAGLASKSYVTLSFVSRWAP